MDVIRGEIGYEDLTGMSSDEYLLNLIESKRVLELTGLPYIDEFTDKAHEFDRSQY